MEKEVFSRLGQYREAEVMSTGEEEQKASAEQRRSSGCDAMDGFALFAFVPLVTCLSTVSSRQEM